MNEPNIIYPPEFQRPVPERVLRPCDYGLMNAASNLEIELGTIEAYNRLCEKAAQMRLLIDRGLAKAANPQYANIPNA